MPPELATPTAPAAPSAAAAASAVGFKEWAVVCAALGCGRQSLILRKGGIAEGRDGFRFQHEAFMLFPTQFHQQFERVRLDAHAPIATDPVAPPGSIEIRYRLTLDFAVWLTDEGQVARLTPWHIWREDVVRERFAYGDAAGLQCAFGRVERASRPWMFPDRPAYGGCRSWVTLPTPPADLRWTPVLSDADHGARRAELQSILDLR